MRFFLDCIVFECWIVDGRGLVFVRWMVGLENSKMLYCWIGKKRVVFCVDFSWFVVVFGIFFCCFCCFFVRRGKLVV